MTHPRQPAWVRRMFHGDAPDTPCVYTLPHSGTLGGMADNKQMRQLVGLLVEQGFDVKLKKNGHYEVRTAEGEFVTTLAGTPSEYRGWKNALATLRRHGFLDPSKPHKKKRP